MKRKLELWWSTISPISTKQTIISYLNSLNIKKTTMSDCGNPGPGLGNHKIGYGAKCHFQQYFSYIMAVSFIGGENRSMQRKPLTCRKSLTNFITWCCMEYPSPSTWFELTTLGTDCTDICKSNDQMIMTMMAHNGI